MPTVNHLLFTKSFTVRWHDMDAFNHVNHTLYLVYMQECRVDWLRQHGINMAVTGSGPVIGEISCRYVRPITYPAIIQVELYFKEKDGSRIYFEHIIRDKAHPNLVYANAQVTVIWMDFATGRSIQAPPAYDYILSQKLLPE